MPRAISSGGAGRGAGWCVVGRGATAPASTQTITQGTGHTAHYFGTIIMLADRDEKHCLVYLVTVVFVNIAC